MLAGAFVTVVVVAGMAGPASAHAQLESEQPNQGAVLLTSPRQVVLHFDEPVEIDFGSLRVLGPGGQRVDEGGTHHPPGDTHSVAVSLPGHLPRGTYVVAWRVISADSHPVHGAFIFSVGSARGSAKANVVARALTSANGSRFVGVVFWVVRAAEFAGLVVAVGAAAVLALLWPAGWGRRRHRRMVWAAWALSLAGSVAGIAIQGVYAGGLPFLDIVKPSLFDEVLHTRFGEVELLRIVVLVVLGVLLATVPHGGRRGSVRWRNAGGAVLCVVLLMTPGLSGHPGTAGNVWVGETLDVVHLGAVSVWLGGLAVLGLVLYPGAEAVRSEELWALATRFLAYAFGAVVAVVASGVVQAIREVGSFYALFHTSYGVTLIVKVALVIVLVGGGAVSRRAVHRAGGRVNRFIRRGRRAAPLGAPPSGKAATAVVHHHPPSVPEPGDGRRALKRSVTAELVIALAVLAVTALLVNAVPAKQAAEQPFSQSFNVLGVQVNAIVAPARTGPGNQVHFYVLGRLGQPVGVPELDAAISLPAQGIGPIALPIVVAGPGHYLSADVDIPLAGDWVLKVTVRTTAIDEQEVVATLPVR
ncbi:MAG TPA: copper resistance protein CopC [Acidimicrobiales bacterium]|nr:copper resistance protein CopC [Acidimicrobiales bacterium]